MRMLTTVLGSYRCHRFAWLFFSLLLTLGGHAALKALISAFNPYHDLNRGRPVPELLHVVWSLATLIKGYEGNSYSSVKDCFS